MVKVEEEEEEEDPLEFYQRVLTWITHQQEQSQQEQQEQLRKTQVYQDFVQSFDRLETYYDQAMMMDKRHKQGGGGGGGGGVEQQQQKQQQKHEPSKDLVVTTDIESITMNHPTTTTKPTTTTRNQNNGCWKLNDHVWHSILQWLDAQTLSQSILPTCRRLYQLTHDHAQLRTHMLTTTMTNTTTMTSTTRMQPIGRAMTCPSSSSFVKLRTLPTALHLLRAQEQLQGWNCHPSTRSTTTTRTAGGGGGGGGLGGGGRNNTRAAARTTMTTNNHNNHLLQSIQSKSTPPPLLLPPPLQRRVCIPLLLLPYAIQVTDAGDEEYNGIYHCTDCNSNGYVFSKPRLVQSKSKTPQPPQQAQEQQQAKTTQEQQQQQINIGNAKNHINNVNNDYYDENPDSMLRCWISKKFSHETLLWYMSKELAPDEVPTSSSLVATTTTTNHSNHNPNNNNAHDDDDDSVVVREWTEDGTRCVLQKYAFWAPLSRMGGEGTEEDATALPDYLCRYPSLTSVMIQQQQEQQQQHDHHHHGIGWQTLSTTQHLHPPTVELLF